jgi:tetrahydromethanopterin S-methyltransferase subunit G
MEGNITTIEDLAALIMETMASKEDIQGLASKEDVQELRTEMKQEFAVVHSRLDTLDTRVDNLDARVGRIEADVHAWRDEMVHRREFEDVLDRVKYIEKKLGIESGVSRVPCSVPSPHHLPVDNHLLAERTTWRILEETRKSFA